MFAIEQVALIFFFYHYSGTEQSCSSDVCVFLQVPGASLSSVILFEVL